MAVPAGIKAGETPWDDPNWAHHGTPTGYRYGCRCKTPQRKGILSCTEANNRQSATYRAAHPEVNTRRANKARSRRRAERMRRELEQDHFLVLRLVNGELRAEFKCVADEGAPCRLDCPESCESFELDGSHEHQLVDGGECLALPWLEEEGIGEAHQGDDLIWEGAIAPAFDGTGYRVELLEEGKPREPETANA